jgi:hypothetical protein
LTYAANRRLAQAVAEIASTADERQRRELVVDFVYGVIEQEFRLSAKQCWRFAEWLLTDRAQATPERERTKRLHDAAAFVRDCRWYMAKYAPPNPRRRAPSTARVLTAQRRGVARRPSPRARERSSQPRPRSRSGSGTRGRPRRSTHSDDDPDPAASRALARLVDVPRRAA